MGLQRPSRRIGRRAVLRAAGVLMLVPVGCTRGDPGAPAGLPDGAELTDVHREPVTLDVARFDAVSACRRTAEQTEGPFHVDVERVRRDITEDVAGHPLRVGLRVRDLDDGCAPIPDAVVELWQADAAGLYSGISAADQGRAEADHEPAENALRGAQVTDDDGIAEFVTIYPGRYPGRTPHLHVKVHIDERTELTSQLYFDDELNAEVLAGAEYAGQAVDALATGNHDDILFSPDLVLHTDTVGEELAGVLTVDISRE